MPTKTDVFLNKKKANKTTWRKGIAPLNPKGRPRDGASWRAILEEVSSMTVPEIMSIIGSDQAKVLKNKPQDVQIKYLVVGRVLVSLVETPNAALWNSLMERTEGKVQDRLEVSSTLDIEGLEETLNKVYGKKGK